MFFFNCVGIIELDQALTLFLSTGIVLGGVVGFTLDNIIPGTYTGAVKIVYMYKVNIYFIISVCVLCIVRSCSLYDCIFIRITITSQLFCNSVGV